MPDAQRASDVGQVDSARRRAREALVILAEPADGAPTVPPEDLAQAMGLAFASVHKGGALVSATSGHGFVIRKARMQVDPGVSQSPIFNCMLMANGVGKYVELRHPYNMRCCRFSHAAQDRSHTTAERDASLHTALVSRA